MPKPQESSYDGDQKGRETVSFVSAIQPVPSHANLSNKHTSRRKRIPQRSWGPKDSNASNNATRTHKQAIPMQEKTVNLKVLHVCFFSRRISFDVPDKRILILFTLHFFQDKLSCWLSSDLARTWCMYEWFYSAIDYPWFAKKEFVEYLNHVGLGEIPRLTRIEWSVIRRS